ncbi:uncharacterized protein LOC130828791 isoform X2 [Amaranthus tricolor]|uniref:uncharacterized protein LOC130828791 isoform X2 n=1 Tax=Amaranthus tricolor TaxID=29722 RepID=UPI00258A59CF|nr:uncharacterized protein LOC130828791 isoform X2 [Amaranthus tricolor]
MKFMTLSSSLKVTLLLSLSFTATSSLSSSSLSSNPKSSSFPFARSSSSPSPKATVSDLLSLLGPKNAVDPIEARHLWSCLKFLVPLNSSYEKQEISVKRRSMVSVVGHRTESEENELIWWPPASVLELARLSVDSGGDPFVIHRALDPTIIHELNAYLVFLFEMIATRGPRVGLNVSLSRYDFFHGHLFLAKDTGRLGILFHAKEYPAYDKEVFPFYMGYCQTGSDVTYDSTMNLRNILWLAPMPSTSSEVWDSPGILVVLDARPDGIIYRDLIPDYVKIARTLYEDDFGEVAVDVNYLNVGRSSSNYQIFIC